MRLPKKEFEQYPPSWRIVVGIVFCLVLPLRTSTSFVLSPPTRIIRGQRHHHPFLSSSINDGNSPIVPKKYNISLLLIDHYDSFTYNLCDMFAQLTVEPPKVIAKDSYEGWNEDAFKNIDGIILSPGPGSPQEQPLLSKQAIRCNPTLPILGVCLGHQLLALEYGADVGKAPVPIHGQDHWITQCSSLEEGSNTTKLWDGLPSSFRVVRYHSLAASSKNFPECLKITATSKDDNVIQGIEHSKNPHYGVQFHPESIGSQHGMGLLENFCKIVEQEKLNQQQHHSLSSSEEEDPHKEENDIRKEPVIINGGDTTEKVFSRPVRVNGEPSMINGDESDNTELFPQQPVQMNGETVKDDDAEEQRTVSKQKPRFQILLHALPPSSFSELKPLQMFDEFYSSESHAMWLDSSSYPSRGTIDILAAPSNNCAVGGDLLEYHVGNDKNNDTDDILTQLETELFGQQRDGASSNEIAVVVEEDFVSSQREEEVVVEWIPDTNLTNPPFDYRGGLLGYLGYEVRHDTQRFLQQQEHGKEKPFPPRRRHDDDEETNNTNATIPTAAFFLARQSMVYHHPTNQWYLLGLVERGRQEDLNANLQWMKTTRERMLVLAEDHNTPIATATDEQPKLSNSQQQQHLPEPLTFVPNRPKENYEQNIADCHEFIGMGESYELCVTNKLEAHVPPDERLSTWQLYRTLRKRNPAPYSAYFRWNADRLAICCSSPERFMSLQRRQQQHPEGPTVLQAEAKPIKGTCARVVPENGVCLTDAESREDERRAHSLELSLKNRAENLMIVDLLRNDMSRVCEVGSVHVAKLMGIESFATVHQMVSTIRGTLSKEATSIDLLKASFPGGSMTGAPKMRTMELLEKLEENVDRGPYAGSLGYLSVNGCMDMNIIIRSAVVTPTASGGRKISVGAGGAITALSETQDEYDEMLLKARAVVQAVQEWAAISSTDSSSRPNAPAMEPQSDIPLETMNNSVSNRGEKVLEC